MQGVVDCPEFLVYLPLLEKLATKFGLLLVGKERCVQTSISNKLIKDGCTETKANIFAKLLYIHRYRHIMIL